MSLLGWVRRWRAKAPLLIYCDGSAHERPARPGGWAFVIIENDVVRLGESGGRKSTNNNEMELEAALTGLRSLVTRGWHVGREVDLISDSRLVVDIANGAEPPRVHAEVGAEVRRLCVEANVRAKWVRGHAGNRWNEHVDEMASEAKAALVPARFK